ncbi:hypothetical protein NIES4073_39650 [Kalymmatonema gypsitolerans NIES-4073]|nr:hypothetical protein NIES4073_39650 [Scytonema sp. NIES-4073]
MTIKQQLLQEIESTPDTILAETLDFLRFLKTKETPTQPLLKIYAYLGNNPQISAEGS